MLKSKGRIGAVVVENMDVFSAFPNAVVSGRFTIGSYQRGTVDGNQFVKEADLDVIIDEGDASDIGSAPNAETLTADLLLYVKPEQLPTTNTRALASGYLIYDSEYEDYFAIINASAGKNQDAGQTEHIELLLRQTDAEAGIVSA